MEAYKKHNLIPKLNYILWSQSELDNEQKNSDQFALYSNQTERSEEEMEGLHSTSIEQSRDHFLSDDIQ